jgi:hypothetical protein
MIYKNILLYIILFLSIFSMGYAIGRRIGKKEGYCESEIIIPIKLKQNMMQSSFCPICCRKLNEINVCDKI